MISKQANKQKTRNDDLLLRVKRYKKNSPSTKKPEMLQ